MRAREPQARRRLRAASDDTRVSSAIGRESSRRAAPRRQRWGGITCRKRDALRPTREATRVSAAPRRVTLRRESGRTGGLAGSDFDYLLWVLRGTTVSDHAIWPLRKFPSRFHADCRAKTLGYLSVDRTDELTKAYE